MVDKEFEIFVCRCRRMLVSVARGYLGDDDMAEDVVQEALLKLYAMRDKLDTYHSVEALARVVVKRLSLNVLRNHQRHRVVQLNVDVSDGGVMDDDRVRVILSLIDGLPDKQQMVLRMKHIEGMEVEEIASVIQMSTDAVYQNLSRARRAILEQFKDRKDG